MKAGGGRISTGPIRRWCRATPIRDYVKWDYQPSSIDGVPESFARAFSVMTTEPQGPVYMCYDAALQEDPLTRDDPAAAARGG